MSILPRSQNALTHKYAATIINCGAFSDFNKPAIT